MTHCLPALKNRNNFYPWAMGVFGVLVITFMLLTAFVNFNYWYAGLITILIFSFHRQFSDLVGRITLDKISPKELEIVLLSYAEKLYRDYATYLVKWTTDSAIDSRYPNMNENCGTQVQEIIDYFTARRYCLTILLGSLLGGEVETLSSVEFDKLLSLDELEKSSFFKEDKTFWDFAVKLSYVQICLSLRH